MYGGFQFTLHLNVEMRFNHFCVRTHLCINTINIECSMVAAAVDAAVAAAIATAVVGELQMANQMNSQIYLFFLFHFLNHM